MVPFNLVAAGSNMPETGGSITPKGDKRRQPCERGREEGHGEAPARGEMGEAGDTDPARPCQIVAMPVGPLFSPVLVAFQGGRE